MSAAAPLPPAAPFSTRAMKGYPNGAGGSRGSDGAGPRGAGGPYPPIAEITASATDKVNEISGQSVARLVEQAKYHMGQAITSVNSRQSPAAAFWEYLVAYKLVSEVIPRKRDYIDRVETNRGQLHRDFTNLCKEIQANEDRFMNIKNIITNDNKRNGAQHPPSQPSSRPTSANGIHIHRDDELMLPDVPSGPPLGRSAPAAPAESPRRKPPVHPKPQSLHGRAVHQSTSSLNGMHDLTERFAKLRGNAIPIDTSSGHSSMDLSVKMPSPSDYSSRPLGPRDMPPPPLPLLNTGYAASLPKEPSPTYSPARNLSLPGNINPPRSTPRSMVGAGRSSVTSSASYQAPNTNGQSDSYFPTQSNVPVDPVPRRKSVSKPVESQITAERLYDYIRMYNVLLIDVRSREEYDAGHIFVHNIMCVEPTSLQDGCSAEQLQDRLVISPDEELSLFERRNEFDLVVYYDESTKTNSFLNRYQLNERERPLKQLYDALYEFNYDKPLQRPPIFLMGGIDAWIDLVGPPALKMTATAAMVASGQTKTRPLKRAPHPTRLQPQNRRTSGRRDYTAMDSEEQRQWMEEARRGRSVVEQAPQEEDEEEVESPVYRTTEDFLRRYPDLEDQQSMMYPPSRPQQTSQYVQPPIPPAPSRPPPSVPRPSYTGVHERQLTRQSSGNQPPVYVSSGRGVSNRLHKTGLINFGVTCYMNSVVQCLSANPNLTAWFLSGRYAEYLQKRNWKGTEGILPEAYATLLSNLYKGDSAALRPSTFRKVCGRFNQTWQLDEQQDAKEFLEFVLDMMHEDLNTVYNKPPLRDLTEEMEMAREQLPRPYAAKIEWNRYLHRNASLIGNLFAGQHASQLTCKKCGITSTTFEAFWSISVEIRQDAACDIRDCLRSYCAVETLDSADTWKCPRCKKHREATKKITITRAPDTLVVHFKRFATSHGQSARKIRTPVHFPLQSLDLAPFMEPPITPEGEAIARKTTAQADVQLTELKTDPAMNPPYMYNAYAIIFHHGATLGSGHYTAAAKDAAKGVWRSFNDDRVRDFDPRSMGEEEREKAYVVFYQRERVAGGI
ncbi:cysteine proteinase [Bimuria novae-zelandiae CBS 107.79]|uniref:Cysteine proteinase n=1 Tax=Bimuria novae-zelandiae CBS 107.79 TaxID=1447943 RepID=A0A6A5VPR8_9PLEO|nr:cysteine proteinase [Bimuria novae-zelandiae CBS 107.79]